MFAPVLATTWLLATLPTLPTLPQSPATALATTDVVERQARQPGDEPRAVLALCDAPTVEITLSQDPFALIYEMPLQHLGMLVERRSLDQGRPTPTALAGVRAVVVYLGCERDGPADTSWLDAWLVDEVAARGVRIVLLNDLGPLAAPPARLLPALGLQPASEWSRDPLLVSTIDEVTGPLVEDAPLRPAYTGVLASSVDGQVWRRASLPGCPDVAPVCTGAPGRAFGGLALAPYAMRETDVIGGRRWRLDLFQFFRAALQLEGVPVPDPVVINGRRAMFVQVDGDGFESWSTARNGALSAEVFRDSVLEAFDLPFTVSVIVASVTDTLRPDLCDPRAALAASIFELPNVEVASHTVLHPLLWNDEKLPSSPPRSITWYDGLEHYTYDQVAEVTKSIEFIEGYLAPFGKRCDVILWSGDAIPPPAALTEARRLGLCNVNGATCRWDAEFDSISYVMPHVRWIGGELQVNCGAANENVFGGFYERLPGAFRHIETTLERTAEGRLLKPANIYVHFYSAERPARMAALLHLLHRFGREEECAPIHASTWWRLCHDAFLRARLARRGDTWHVQGAGAARTLRFDDESRHVDLARSEGVLGQRHLNGSLYVHLAASDAQVLLTSASPATPFLEQANHPALDASRAADGVAWRATSVARRAAVVAGFLPGAVVHLQVGDSVRAVTADERGRVAIDLAPGDDRIEARVR